MGPVRAAKPLAIVGKNVMTPPNEASSGPVAAATAVFRVDAHVGLAAVGGVAIAVGPAHEARALHAHAADAGARAVAPRAGHAAAAAVLRVPGGVDAGAGTPDAIPAHLLTREAIALYLSRLGPRGTILMHLSNRHLDLSRIVARAATEHDLLAWEGLDAFLSCLCQLSLEEDIIH